MDEGIRMVEIIGTEGLCASLYLIIRKEVIEVCFGKGLRVLVAHNPATGSLKKRPAFQTKFMATSTVFQANHPLKELVSDKGKHTRCRIHERLLVPFVDRQKHILIYRDISATWKRQKEKLSR